MAKRMNASIPKKVFQLEIKLKSDMCAGTGDSLAGLIDSKTAVDRGIPVIPAKRIKGCLALEGMEMCANNMIEQSILTMLFGKAGAEDSGMLRIGDARLREIPKEILGSSQPFRLDDYEEMQRELAGITTKLSGAWLEEQLTRTRTRTAIDEKIGSASDHTLRTIQVVPKGMVFISRIECCQGEDPEVNQRMEQALRNCVKALRHIGIGITRGLGEVKCDLTEWNRGQEDTAGEALQLKVKDVPNRDIEVIYELELKAPLLFAGRNGLTDDCCDQIPGASVLGAFAGMYLQDHPLGGKAHEDKDFRRMFLEDGVMFGDAFLVKEGHVFFPCPANLARKKEEAVSLNLLGGKENVRRKEIGSLVSARFDGKEILLADTEKEVRMHHARPEDKAVAHALNDWAGESDGQWGQFYSYACLSKGQRFCGVMKGRPEDLSRLSSCLMRRNHCLYLGRSRTAEYGEVSFRWKASAGQEGEEREKQTDRWLLWFLSPCVLMDDDSGDIIPDIRLLKKQLETKYQWRLMKEQCILKLTKVGGYNSKWLLPSPQYPAFAPGTVLAVKTERACRASEMEQFRLGEFTGKGYGQYKALPLDVADQMDECLLREITGNYAESADSEAPSSDDCHHPFLKMMVKRKCAMEARSGEREEAMRALKKFVQSGERQTASQKYLPNMTTVSWLIDAVESSEYSECSEILNSIINKIADVEKRKRVKRYLQPCQHHSREFVLDYLECTKWEIRREGRRDA